MNLHLKAPSVAAGLLALSLGLASCTDTDLAGRILYVDAQGVVIGLVYQDYNGNGVRDGADAPVRGLEMRLLVEGTRSVTGTATTDANGIFLMEAVPVGRLRVEADSAFLGDSLRIFDFEDAELTVRAADTLVVTVGVTFPSFTLTEVRSLPEGVKGFIQGIVLNPRDPSGDGSLHLQAGETFLRVLGTQRAVTFLPGDSVRILGRTAREVGQPVLRTEEAFLLAQRVVVPRPLEFTTAMAATADDGEKDAALVRIRDAAILDTVTVTGLNGRDLHMTVDDGSGEVRMILAESGGFNLNRVHPDSFTVREATGLLVATQTAQGIEWRLHPRTSSDLVIDPIPFPAQVTNLTVVDKTSTTLTLNWTEVADGLGSPSDYVVQFRPVTTLAWTQIDSGECAAPVAGSAVGSVAACIMEGLTPNTIYFFQVMAFRGRLGVDAEFGPWSNIAGAATLP